MPQTSKRPELDPKDLEKKIGESLKQYDGRSTLEIVALFLGKAQILEQGLKGILIQTTGWKKRQSTGPNGGRELPLIFASPRNRSRIPALKRKSFRNSTLTDEERQIPGGLNDKRYHVK